MNLKVLKGSFRLFIAALFLFLYAFPAYADIVEIVDDEEDEEQKTGDSSAETEKHSEESSTETAETEETDRLSEETAPDTAKEPEKTSEIKAAAAPKEALTFYGPPSISGAFGLNRTLSAQYTEPLSFRFGLMGQWAIAKGFLSEKVEGSSLTPDVNQRMVGVLALGFSPIKYLEIHGAISWISNQNTLYPEYTTAESVQLLNIGDFQFGLKGGYAPLPYLYAGLDVNVDLNARPGDSRPYMKATGVVPTAILTFDARGIHSKVPIVVHLNVGGYLINPNGYNRTDVTIPIKNKNGQPYNFEEVKPKFDSVEQYGLDIIQSPQFIFRSALELPLWYAAPFVEYSFMTGWGFHAVTPGVRIYPLANDSLSISFAVDVGLFRYEKERVVFPIPPKSDDPNYYDRLDVYAQRIAETTLQYEGVEINRIPSRSTPPTPPWNLLFGVSYSFDITGGGKYEPPPGGMLFGRVVDASTGYPIGGAVVSVSPGVMTAYATSEESGGFGTGRLNPGDYEVKITHPDYEELRQPVTIKDKEAVTVRAALKPIFGHNEGRLFARVTNSENKGETAELIIKALKSDGENGAKTIKTDPELGSAEIMLAAGEYEIGFKASEGELDTKQIVVERKGTTYVTFRTVVGSSGSSVDLTVGDTKLLWDRIEPSEPLRFAEDGINPAPDQEKIFKEIAEIVKRNPSIGKLAVIAHTDDRGDPEELVTKSEQRSEAFKKALVKAGVSEEMLEARGMGPTSPIASNRTAFGRGMNNRVEFVIAETGAGEATGQQ